MTNYKPYEKAAGRKFTNKQFFTSFHLNLQHYKHYHSHNTRIILNYIHTLNIYMDNSSKFLII